MTLLGSLPYARECLKRAAACAFVAALAASCSARRTEFAPPLAPPDAFSSTGVDALPERWWTTFGDEHLDRLVESAFSENFSFQTVWDRLAHAEAAARIEGAELYPQIDVSASGARFREDFEGDVSSRSEFGLGLSASYELDLWGRVRSRRAAAALDVEASYEEVAAAAITLSASVAEAWYRLAEAREEQRVLREQVDTNEKVLELITLRFRQGQAAAADVFRQRQLVEATRGDLILAESRMQEQAHLVAVLLGKPPRWPLPVEQATLVDLPPLPETGVPAALIQKRPDVRSAYLAVQAADRRVAEAIADRFPRIAITASGDTSADGVRDLFDNWIATIGANLVQPVLDGGRRRAEVDRRRAVLSEAVHLYGQTILDTLQEVEDALTREAHQAEFIGSLSKQLATAQNVIDRTRDSYLKGQLDYLRVLDALTSRQALEREYVVALREQISFRIDLSRAIAAGVPLSRPEIARLEPDGAPSSNAAAGARGSDFQ